MRATTKVQCLQGRVPQDFQQVCGSIGTFGFPVKAPGVLKRGLWGSKDSNLFAAPLASDFCKSDHLQLSISHLWTFNVAKCCQRNSRDNGFNIRRQKNRRRISRKPKATVFGCIYITIHGHLYTTQLLHQAPFTIFTLDTFYTRHLLHQTPVTPHNFYNKQFLHQAPFTPDNFYNKQFLHQVTRHPLQRLR